MPGLKKHYSDFTFSGNKVTPDEIDRYEQYVIIKPTASASYIGTIDPGTVDSAFDIDNTRLDYPRNLLIDITGPSGGAGGTVTITGKDQFGVALSEILTIASANGGGTAQGSAVFAGVSAATYGHNGIDNQSTVTLGVAIGTSADDLTAKFGLLCKIGGTADIKAITWIDNNTAKLHTTEAAASTQFHAFETDEDVNAQDDYVVLYKPTYDHSNESNQTGL